MIIIHSKKLLEQLSEIEEQIKIWETFLDTSRIEMDRDRLLSLIITKHLNQDTNKKGPA
jgi:hypothetical protein